MIREHRFTREEQSSVIWGQSREQSIDLECDLGTKVRNLSNYGSSQGRYASQQSRETQNASEKVR
jgi:hypothetical protein